MKKKTGRRANDPVGAVKSAYKKVVTEYKKKVKSEDLDHRYIEKFLLLLKAGDAVLDLGAGTGDVSAEMMEKHRLKVKAIDVSKEMIDLAKKQYPNLKIMRMDLRRLDFAPRSFDAVFANYSLIHIPETDVEATLRGIARILKPRGFFYLALQEPVTPMDKDGYYPLVYRRSVKMFINLFSEKEMRRYLKRAGFKVVWCERRVPDKRFEFPFNKLFIAAQKA